MTRSAYLRLRRLRWINRLAHRRPPQGVIDVSALVEPAVDTEAAAVWERLTIGRRWRRSRKRVMGEARIVSRRVVDGPDLGAYVAYVEPGMWRVHRAGEPRSLAAGSFDGPLHIGQAAADVSLRAIVLAAYHRVAAHGAKAGGK